MNSYDIGSILGRSHAGARKKAGRPFSAPRTKSAAISYFGAASLAFVNLNKQDFIDGFCDGAEASFKGQLDKATG